MVALAARGTCTFVSKAQRAQAAGAIGLILADNRFGEAERDPAPASGPGSDDRRPRRRAPSRLPRAEGRPDDHRSGRGPVEIVTGRSGIVTSSRPPAPTNFGHSLKPDVAAPGGQILSSTSPGSAGAGSPFAVFDGTSMSAPHVTGAAALLLQAHPTWTPRQTVARRSCRRRGRRGATPLGPRRRLWCCRAAASSTSFVPTSRTSSPPPSPLSFGDIDVNRGPQTRALATQLDDAGGGAGTWSVELLPQAASAGATVEPTEWSRSRPEEATGSV